MNPYEPPQTNAPIATPPATAARDASAWWFFLGVMVTHATISFAMSMSVNTVMNIGLPNRFIETLVFTLAQSVVLALFANFFYLLASSFITIGIFRLNRPRWLLVNSAFIFTGFFSLRTIFLQVPRASNIPVFTPIAWFLTSIIVCICVEVGVGLRASLKEVHTPKSIDPS